MSPRLTSSYTYADIYSFKQDSTTIQGKQRDRLPSVTNPARYDIRSKASWSSADSTVASVDDSNNMSSKPWVGSAVITATNKAGDPSKLPCAVTVNSPLTGITINPTSVTVNENGFAAVKFTLEPSDTTELLKNIKSPMAIRPLL